MNASSIWILKTLKQTFEKIAAFDASDIYKLSLDIWFQTRKLVAPLLCRELLSTTDNSFFTGFIFDVVVWYDFGKSVITPVLIQLICKHKILDKSQMA